MKNTNKLSAFALVPSLAFMAVAAMPSMASEGVSPLQPGATTGAPAGALPPPGFYLNMDADYEAGQLKDGNGDNATIPTGQTVKASNISSVVALTWSTEYELLGARYAAAIAQPYKWANTKFESSTSNSEVSAHGMINTAITPLILSWDLGEGNFVSTGLTFVLDNGDFSSTYNSTLGRNVKNDTAIGNNYRTVETSFAFTHFGEKWALTANNIFDFNGKNSETSYESGDFYYLDLTATTTSDKWTYGAIANYTKQFTDDKVNGTTVAAVDGLYSEGNRAEHVLAGAMLSYNFGKFAISGRVLASLQAKNDADVSFFHVGLSVPL